MVSQLLLLKSRSKSSFWKLLYLWNLKRPKGLHFIPQYDLQEMFYLGINCKEEYGTTDMKKCWTDEPIKILSLIYMIGNEAQDKDQKEKFLFLSSHSFLLTKAEWIKTKPFCTDWHTTSEQKYYFLHKSCFIYRNCIDQTFWIFHYRYLCSFPEYIMSSVY